jgi:hypothetical protein
MAARLIAQRRKGPASPDVRRAAVNHRLTHRAKRTAARRYIALDKSD